jgi:hypothetical protein
MATNWRILDDVAHVVGNQDVARLEIDVSVAVALNNVARWRTVRKARHSGVAVRRPPVVVMSTGISD